MTEAILDLRPTRNKSTTLSTEVKRAMQRLYDAHMQDHRIASDLGLSLADVARWRASRFLQAK